jgi:phage tail sheath protein FI
MATYLSPGVYVEEVATGPKPIAGLPTNVAAIIGQTERGPVLEPKRLTSWNDYIAAFGAPLESSFTAESAFGFFENGGTALYVVRADNSVLGKWKAIDGTNATSFPIEAASPGGWSSDTRIEIGRDAGGGRGNLYSAILTVPAGGLSLSGGTQRTLNVDSALSTHISSSQGARPGSQVTIADHAGNSVEATIDEVTPGSIKVTPTTAGPTTVAGAVRISEKVASGAAEVNLAVGSGFQKGDLIRAVSLATPASVATAVVDEPHSSGASVRLELSPALSAGVTAVSFGRKVVAFPARAVATVVSGKTQVARTSLTYEGTPPDIGTGDAVKLVTDDGIEASFSSTDDAFKFDATLDPPPTEVNVYGKVSVSPWQEPIQLTIPGGLSAADLSSRLSERFPFVPGGSALKLTKSGGSDTFTRATSGSSWTGTPPTADTAYTRAEIDLVAADATRGVLLKSPAAPEIGDVIKPGTVDAAIVKTVTQEPGMAANVYKVVFESGFAVGSTATAPTGTSWAVSAWQPTDFQTLRFSIRATSTPEGRPVVSELYDNLSLNPAHPRYYLRQGLINEQSQLIAVGARTGTAALTAATSLPVTGALDGVGTDGGLDVERFRLALEALERTPEPAMVAAPDAHKLGDDMSTSAAINAMISHCEEHRRFAVVDLPDQKDDQKLVDWRLTHLSSTYAAGYAPFISILSMRPRSVERTAKIPPSGFVMGVFARTDDDRGVWKAPANEQVRSVTELSVPYTQRRQDLLNPQGVNVIRSFPGRGMRIWGGRNLTDDTSWRYVNVRRLFLMIENSIDAGTQWVVFEPNDATTWLRVRVSVENFLNQIWRAGGLAGASPEQAYRVRVGLGQTMTETDIELGLLIIEVAVAPVYPAEFVVFRISHKRLAE